MKVTLNTAAEKLIRTSLADKPGMLRIVYDTENCGCGMSGVPGLQLVSKPGDYDIPLENDAYPFWIDRMQAVFFEEELTLSGEETTETFRLDGRSQFYKSNIRLVDRR
ncbi:iron-sulfur cluster biosynthesis family protein [Paenibacillus macerans]|uniref:Iron-sulfur cluster biosynthesis family protein n=1 Tax=Paenibacillus macerans TaxID=44252 RepID=A0A6N8F1R6_PAEMA|nr:iron-sulfur cluster biosynthesis family protein [Paenibacillus macerans]MED4957537.1 iron-sulfur cluster biosynthesis family protein [Paenibacillus macerans]MUG24638.1 iron-sulfur cluster biosynthesis family protein [Paenibacillus macerans]